MVADPWTSFAETLTKEMTRTGTSTRDLQRRLVKEHPTVTEQTVANWRRGRSRPSLDMLGSIVDAVNLDRRTPAGEEPFSLLVLLQKMHVMPDSDEDPEIYDRAYRLLKLQMKQQDAEDAFAAVGRKGGSARIVQAAVSGTRWAVAVWPAYEGPSADYRLHIADHIDIRRNEYDENGIDDIDASVWADPAMKASLRQTNAVPSNELPRWSEATLPSTEGRPEYSDVSRWSVSHVNSPREPVVSEHWANIRGIAIVATTRASMVHEVASLVAIGLGYGFVSTFQLAMTAVGRRPSQTRLVDQYKQHLMLLTKPPYRRVWSHVGVPPGLGDRPFGTYSNVEGSTPRFVMLDETVALLKETVSDRLTLRELADARDRLATAAKAFPGDHLLQLPTHSSSDNHARWAQVFEQAAQILEWLSTDMGDIPLRVLREAHRHSEREDPDVAAPFLRWLREQKGWPASIIPPARTDQN